MAKKNKAASAVTTESVPAPAEPAVEAGPAPIDLPTVSFDNGHGGGMNAKLVVGRLTAIRGGGEDEDRILVITDRDGKEHRAVCNNNQTLWTGLWSHGLAEQTDVDESLVGGYKGAMGFCKLDTSTQNTVLQTNPGLARDTIFRIALDGKTDHGTCIGMVTGRYKVINIEDLTAVIQEALPNAEVTITQPSSGVEGGVASIRCRQVGEDGEVGAFEANIVLDAGTKNGITAIRGTAAAGILKCSNQLSFEVASMLGEDFVLPTVANGFRVVHAGDFIASLKEQLGLFSGEGQEGGGALGQLVALVEGAQNIQLTDEQVGLILGFYRKTKRISRKTADLVRATYGQGESIQHVEGTLYGLAMAVTYVGTHNEQTTEGVNERLRQLGGELLIVGSDWDRYMALVGDPANQPPPDPEPKPKAEPKPKKAKKTKAEKPSAPASNEPLPSLPAEASEAPAPTKRRSKKAAAADSQ